MILQTKIHHPTPASTTAPPPSESMEMRWLRGHQVEIGALKGEWLLIAGDQLLAHNRDFREIRAAIAQNNVVSPFTYYVPTEQESYFTLL